MATCKKCGKHIEKNERAVYKRMVNRAAAEEELLCKNCLAEHFGVEVSVIDKKIEHFKSIGCTLFN
ncbi:MAG: hypothetical protein E7591_03570 [Ruminococcaceae bacterium]|nr:hypothetical protein [Oscillospiraceae bacterium]